MDKLISAELSRVFRVELEGVQLLPDGRAMLLFSDYSLPIDTQGDGARAVFRALTLLATMRDTLLILEEPECHQHPGSLGRFAAAICGLARQRSVQLMLTTHSLECVRAFFAGARAAGTEAKLFNLELSDGVLSARSVSAEAAEGLDAAGVDVRELDLYA
ncbi:MAG TPA: AAA family ATPase [Myxococcota bacterium]|nr:AAA family ATPase [Myxococcota bacterium]